MRTSPYMSAHELVPAAGGWLLLVDAACLDACTRTHGGHAASLPPRSHRHRRSKNADDNSYPPGVVPALEFVLGPGAIAVLNNEAGLSAADVAALCDVGASSKGAGGIGYKGIGFKSVFKVRCCSVCSVPCIAACIACAHAHTRLRCDSHTAAGALQP